MFRFRQAVLVLLFLLSGFMCPSFFAPMQAKCPWALIRLNGEVNGKASANLRLDFEVESTTPGDSHRKIRQESTIRDSHFDATLYFDTLTSVKDGQHFCSRKPRTVTVSLVEAEQTISRKVLDVEKDFRRTDEGDYEVVQPLVLHIAAGNP